MSETEKTLRGYHNFSLTELFKVWTTVLIKAGMDPEKANRYAEVSQFDSTLSPSVLIACLHRVSPKT